MFLEKRRLGMLGGTPGTMHVPVCQ